MRVTIVVSAIDSSGGFRVVATLGQRLLERGHSVCVIAPQPAKISLKEKVKARLRGNKSAVRLDPSHYLGTLPAVPVDHAGPLTREDFPDADIIIGTWWQTMEWLDVLPVEKGLKVHLVQDYESWPPNNVARVDRVLRLSYPKIAISSYLYDLLVDEFGNDEIYLLPNAVDHSLFFTDPRAKGNSTTVGFTYSFDQRKGSDLIVKAVTQAREHFPALKVLAFGHTPPRAPIPVPEWIEFHVLPTTAEIRALYKRCDAWLFGSRREGFGLPILEAMACGTPVIGMPAGAALDLLTDGAGILLADHDWQNMAREILNVTAMPDDQWQALSQRAHRRAQENHWDVVGGKLEQILVGVLAEQPAGRKAARTAAGER